MIIVSTAYDTGTVTRIMYIHVHVHVVHACIPDIYVLFQQGESLLHAATSSGQLEVVKFLHDKLADVKAVDKVSVSP